MDVVKAPPPLEVLGKATSERQEIWLGKIAEAPQSNLSRREWVGNWRKYVKTVNWHQTKGAASLTWVVSMVIKGKMTILGEHFFHPKNAKTPPCSPLS